MRFINTLTHGALDYGSALVLIILPFILGIGGTAAGWTLLIAGLLVLGASALTRYELGLVRVLPMPVHLAGDALVGVFLIASPWLFGFADEIVWPHLVFGIAEIGAALTTRTHSPVESPSARPA